MKRPLAIDLFCGAGGVSKGLVDAGFDVIGVDLNDQPEYPYRFFKSNAVTFDWRRFNPDFLWFSPPCQNNTAYKRRPNHVRPVEDLIPAAREIAVGSGLPYVIENVPGAPLIDPVMLCGSMFGLDVRRHRLFESSFLLLQPECRHELQLPRFPQATNRKNLRRTVEVGVWRIPLETQQKAMGIDWMSLPRLSQAIPPAYSKWIGEQALKVIRRAG